MISAVILTAVLGAAPPPPAVAKYAMPGLNCVNVDDKTCTFFGEYLAEQLSRGGGVEITTQSEIGAVLGLERQRQLMGCADADTSCLAELAGALGADALLLGSVAKVGADFVVSAKVVRTRDAKTLGSASRRVRAESDLLDALGAIALDLRQKLSLGPAPGTAAPAAAVAAPGRPVPMAVWALGGGGLAAALGGGGLMLLAHDTRRELHATQDRTSAQLAEVVGRGQLFQNVGMPLLIVGSAAVAAAGGLWAFDAAAAPKIALTASSQGWALTFGGELR